MKPLLFLYLCLLFSSQINANETLRVGLIEGGRAPYFFAKNSQETGIYKDILQAVTRISQIQFTYDYYPQARLRKMMLSGRLDIEMGTDPSWRQAKNEVERSVYSTPFMDSRESWVVAEHNEDKISDFISAPGLARPCLVLGFNVEDTMKQAHADVKGNSDLHLLEMVVRKRCDIALIPNAVLEHYQVFQDPRFATSQAEELYRLSIRLRKSKADLLPKINNALQQLKNSGELQVLMENYGINNNG